MKPNTLTTIEDLRPGDIFRPAAGNLKLIKVSGQPFRKNKELFTCWAKPVKGVTPIPFRGKTAVIFLKRSKSIFI